MIGNGPIKLTNGFANAVDQPSIFACIAIGQYLSKPYREKPKARGCLWHITIVVKQILE